MFEITLKELSLTAFYHLLNWQSKVHVYFAISFHKFKKPEGPYNLYP